MSQSDNSPVSSRRTPQLRSLGRDALVLAIDLPGQTLPRIEKAGGGAVSPLVTLRLPLEDGGMRTLWGLRGATLADGLRLYAGALAAPREISPLLRDDMEAAEPEWLLADLAARERINLVSALFGVWSAMLKLRRDSAFAAFARKLAGLITPQPPPARIVAALGEDSFIATTWIGSRFGKPRAVYRIGSAAVQPLMTKVHLDRTVRGRRQAYLAGPAAAGETLVLVGEAGLAVRRLAAASPIPLLARWWRTTPASDNVRSYLVRMLAEGRGDGSRRALEFQLAAPLKPRTAAGRGQVPSAQVNLAFASGGDLVVGGWIRDPAGLVAGIDLLDADEPKPIEDRWCRFGAETPEGPVNGFLAHVPKAAAGGALLQPRLQLRLASGAVQPLVPEPQPLEAMERRSRLLRSVPPEHIDEALLESVLAPALAGLQSEIAADAAADEEVIGAPLRKPRISLVIPLYKVLDFLRTQYAAFAGDPGFVREAELIYVLDSPEQADDVRHLLMGLNLLYGLPVRLAVMRRNSGYALACNAGARLASGRCLLLVNSDVVPAENGWMAPLAEQVLDTQGVAAAGPKLLFEDDSLQHAGLYFDRDHYGRWLNHHFYKGFARHFPPACVPRLVPAVTGACLAVRRDVFEAVGGFTEDYVIGDYEDSDLCLKIRRAGHAIAYVPSSELYHFERQSIRQSVDYVRGAAARYNAWLHARRWMAQMSALRGSSESPDIMVAA